MNRPFTGKRIGQDSAKLAQLKRREKRLRRKGLSVLSFTDPKFPWIAYFKQRNEQRKQNKESEE